MPSRQHSPMSHSARLRRVEALNTRYEGSRPWEIIERVVREEFPGDAALISSFGAESVVLLHMVASVDPTTPVVFLDTGYQFEETLAYRDRLIETLGLTQVISAEPDAEQLAAEDLDGLLHRRDANFCCHLRKTLPMLRAVRAYGALLTGRKRFQSTTRAALPLFEVQDSWIKVNPLALMSRQEIEAYAELHRLPRHPLVRQGYRSIGCRPCTVPVKPGDDDRAGRWPGLEKTECGIHFGASGQPVRRASPQRQDGR